MSKIFRPFAFPINRGENQETACTYIVANVVCRSELGTVKRMRIWHLLVPLVSHGVSEPRSFVTSILLFFMTYCFLISLRRLSYRLPYGLCVHAFGDCIDSSMRVHEAALTLACSGESSPFIVSSRNDLPFPCLFLSNREREREVEE